MSTFDDVARKAEADKAFLGALVASPKKALSDAGIDLVDPEDFARAELFARTAAENVAAAARVVGIDPGDTADWGIGAGCCKTKTIALE